MSLLLPAVQAIRETANRSMCSNNLRQLGLAVLAYEANFQVLPASGIVDPPSHVSGYAKYKERSGKMYSWIMLILPQMDQEPLYDSFDLTKTITQQTAVNGKYPHETVLPTLLCPSDGGGDTAPYEYQSRKFAKGNYAAWVSPYHMDDQSWYPGALIAHRPQTMGMIRDGASNTLLGSEVRTREEAKDERGAWALPWAGTTLLSFDGHPTPNSTPVGNPPSAVYKMANGSKGLTQFPNCQGPNMDTLYDCPNSQDAQLQKMPCLKTKSYNSAAPRSLHPGGVNVVYLDGHMGFLNDGVDEFTMSYMISVDDGQAITIPD